MKKKEKWIFENNWLVFYFTLGFDISYSICGYFDNRPRINLTLLFFRLCITLPFRNDWTDECDPPKWGIAIHNNTFWVYKGGKGNWNGGNETWSFSIPFVEKNWVRTSILLKDGNWEHETKGNYKSFYEEEWKEKQAVWEYDYTDKYDGEVIPTKIYIEEREWRPKWLGWTSLFATVRRTIDVHFSKECGRRKGGWKGGCLGCGYEMKPEEHPIDCVKRMEKERVL